MKPLAYILLVVVNLLLVVLTLRYYPVGNGRDELDHLRLIHFYKQNRLPELPDDLDAATIQAHQPPLYYALASRLSLAPPPENPLFNPFLESGNYNPAIDRANRQLYFGDFSGIFRYWHLLLTLVGIALHYRLARDLLPQNLALVSLACLTLAPAFWRFMLPASNNLLLWVIANGLLLCLARSYGWRWVGLLFGLGLLTKIYALPLAIPISYTYRRAAWKPFLLAFAISGWWYLRNVALYSDPTAALYIGDLSAANHAFEIPNIWSWLGEVWLESWTILNTRETLYLASGVGAFLLLRSTKIPLLWVTLSAGFAFAMLGESFNAHAHYSPPLMIVSLSPLMILLASGTQAHLVPIFALIALALPFQSYFVDSLFPYGITAENKVTIPLGEGAILTGYEVESSELVLGEVLYIRLCWDAPYADLAYSVQLHLADLPLAGQQDSVLDSGCDRVSLRVSQDAASPRAYEVLLTTYQRRPYQKLGSLLLGRAVVWDGEIRDGEPLRVTVAADAVVVEWNPQSSMQGVFHYFLHSTAADGTIISQYDAPLAYPPAYWIRGASFAETLPQPNGGCRLLFGLYKLTTGERPIELVLNDQCSERRIGGAVHQYGRKVRKVI